MKNSIIKPGDVTRIGELIEADNKTYGEETRERNARQRKWKQPVQPVRERRHQTVAVGPESALCLFLFFVAVAAFCKLLALIV